MANADVRAALATLDAAIQALDTSGILAADFTKGEEVNGPGFRFHLTTEVEKLQVLSTATVAELAALRELED